MYEARSLPVLHIRKPLGIGPGRPDPERAEGGGYSLRARPEAEAQGYGCLVAVGVLGAEGAMCMVPG